MTLLISQRTVQSQWSTAVIGDCSLVRLHSLTVSFRYNDNFIKVYKQMR